MAFLLFTYSENDVHTVSTQNFFYTVGIFAFSVSHICSRQMDRLFANMAHGSRCNNTHALVMQVSFHTVQKLHQCIRLPVTGCGGSCLLPYTNFNPFFHRHRHLAFTPVVHSELPNTEIERYSSDK